MKHRRALILLSCSVLIVALLVCGCTLWVWQAKQQYALNRQLIAALMMDENNTKQALGLVNAGADPNTRQNPFPAPTFKRLLNQLLHRSSVPTGGGPTALMIACGSRGEPMIFWPGFSLSLDEHALTENRLLVEAMLVHGANVDAKDTQNYNHTALFEAIGLHRAHTVELLLQHGADVNVQEDLLGDTPLALTANDPQLAIARLLLAHGANPNAQNRQGETPLMLAQRLNRADMVALLRKGVK